MRSVITREEASVHGTGHPSFRSRPAIPGAYLRGELPRAALTRQSEVIADPIVEKTQDELLVAPPPKFPEERLDHAIILVRGEM